MKETGGGGGERGGSKLQNERGRLMLTDQSDRTKFLYMDGHTESITSVMYCLALCGNCVHTMNVNQASEFCYVILTQTSIL